MKSTNSIYKKYKVVECPNCHQISAVNGVVSAKCFYCGKITKFFEIDPKIGTVPKLKVYKSYNNAIEAVEYTQLLKEQIANKR